ncbi:MAG: urease accessory protein UreE [Flavobacteriales bacterium]|nr:urease accessory protein UreE [Flavobacteriales bacterium]
MIIEHIVGNLRDMDAGGRRLDPVRIQWFEAGKRIQRRKSDGGLDLAIRFFKEGQRLQQDDILFMDEERLVVVEIEPCEAIQVTPGSLYEMGSACYEIGNKHLPLFIQDDVILLPFEAPIFRWLSAKGFRTEKVEAKLLNLLNTTVQPHGHALEGEEGGSLFSKIMALAGK